MLFDFAAVESPLSDSLVIDRNPGWKRIGWTPFARPIGFVPSPRNVTRRPKR